MCLRSGICSSSENAEKKVMFGKSSLCSIATSHLKIELRTVPNVYFKTAVLKMLGKHSTQENGVYEWNSIEVGT